MLSPRDRYELPRWPRWQGKPGMSSTGSTRLTMPVRDSLSLQRGRPDTGDCQRATASAFPRTTISASGRSTPVRCPQERHPA
ncbi:conserved hypothetical protein [Ricinus communis]|uniref:Uncharacterized protein n=1 Tax=Ricinus communis TaxID=3988 RepID=B9THS5_RICCO|nr:conserved hypothetical protein [Ricinus communis]